LGFDGVWPAPSAKTGQSTLTTQIQGGATHLIRKLVVLEGAAGIRVRSLPH